MSITCPKCNGDNTQSVSLFFESAMRSTAGSQDPALLQAAAPPKRGSYFHIFECWFVGTMVMDLVSSACRWPKVYGQSLISALLIASVYMVARAYAYNRSDWPGLYDKWQQSYICLQCSNIFEAGAKSQAAPREE